MASATDPPERYEELVRLIAHDLRNPLTAVQLNGQLLEHAASRAGQEKQRRWARLIVEAARRMDDLVGKLVEAERIRSGRIPLARETVVLARVLPDAAAGLGPAAGKVRMVPTPESIVFCGDRTRIGQGFAALLRIAGQEADPGSDIVVETWARDGQVGCSIRAPRAAPPTEGGLPDSAGARALAGRSILEHFARTIVECHGGTLRVDLGDGSVFGYEIAVPVPAT